MLGGVALIGIVILKSDILSKILPDFGSYDEEPLEGEEGYIEDLDGDAKSPNQIASNTLSNPLVAVNYYAGKIAGMIASMAARNIYDATQIKEYLIDRHIAEVEHISQLVEYKITKIDYTNIVALREIARLCLDSGKELRIEFEINDALALEVLGNVGRGYSTLPPSSRNEMVLGNVSRYIMDRFNGAPAVRIPNDQAMIDQQFRDFEDSGYEGKDDDDDDDDDKKKKSKYVRKAMGGFRDYPYYSSNQYFDLNSAYQLPSNRFYPLFVTNPFSLRRYKTYEHHGRGRGRFGRRFKPHKKYYNYNRNRYNYWWWY